MKNSLFKRAMAVVSAVPLALTQCLGVANAVDVTDAAPAARLTGESATLNDGSESALFYIEPNEINEKYTKNKGESEGSYIFTKDSIWYSDVYNILTQIGHGENNSGTIDASTIYASALNKAGKYRDIAEKVVDSIGEMTYNVDEEGNLTIKGDVDNVTSVLEEMGQKMIGDSLKNLADKYDMPELAEIKFFDGLEIAGSIEIVVNSSSLNDGESTSATVIFTDKVGNKQYKGLAVRDYVKAQLNAIEATAKKTIGDLVEKYDLDDEEFEAKVQESDEYKKLIDDLKHGYTPKDDEIENMVLESAEFQQLVADQMSKYGLSEAEAKDEVINSEKYQEMMDRFTQGINLDDDSIKEILAESDEYNQLVEDYMAENQVDEATAMEEVLQSDAYTKLFDDFKEKHTYTDEEISEMIKGTDTYVNKLASLREEYETQYADMKAKANSVESKITKMVSYANDKIDVSDKYIDKVMTYSATKTADSVSEIIEAINKKIPAIESKIENVSEKAADKISDIRDGRTIPTSGAAIAANETVQKVYNEIMNSVFASSPVAIDISAADWGELADDFTNITASVDNGVATFTANLTDKEADAVKAYIEPAYSVEVTDIHKEIEITVDFTQIETAGSVSYDMNIKRVILADEVIPVTTTTSSTSTTDTSTTDTVTTATGTDTNVSGSDTGTTPTDTNVSGSDTGTTPTDTTPTDTNVSGSDTGTTPTDTDTTPTGTDTETTPTGSGTDTTPTDTDTTPTGTNTETTPTGSGTDTTPTDTTPTDTGTTTTAVQKYVVNIKTETEVGFYLNTDDEFNKEQLSEIKYSVDYSTVYYDGDGNVLGQEVLVPGTKIDILDLVEFKDVPSEVFEVNNKNTVYQFATQVPVYAAEDIIAEDGTVIANAGEILKNVNGSDVSVTAYIGIKGDGNLDMKADAEDASLALKWYSASMTGVDLETLRFTNENNILVNKDPMLDELAAFLCDVNNENNSRNWKMRKPARTIGSDDASFILAYYSKVMTGNPAGKATWTDVLGEWAKK